MMMGIGIGMGILILFIVETRALFGIAMQNVASPFSHLIWLRFTPDISYVRVQRLVATFLSSGMVATFL